MPFTVEDAQSVGGAKVIRPVVVKPLVPSVANVNVAHVVPFQYCAKNPDPTAACEMVK